jgi:hypothetical protein
VHARIWAGDDRLSNGLGSGLSSRRANLKTEHKLPSGAQRAGRFLGALSLRACFPAHLGARRDNPCPEVASPRSPCRDAGRVHIRRPRSLAHHARDRLLGLQKPTNYLVHRIGRHWTRALWDSGGVCSRGSYREARQFENRSDHAAPVRRGRSSWPPLRAPKSRSTIYAAVGLAPRCATLNMRRSRGTGSANRNPCPYLMPRERTRLR